LAGVWASGQSGTARESWRFRLTPGGAHETVGIANVPAGPFVIGPRPRRLAPSGPLLFQASTASVSLLTASNTPKRRPWRLGEIRSTA